MGQKTGDKLGWETSQEGEHSIPDQMGDKLGDKAKDKKKTSPGHPRLEPCWATRPETRERRTPAQMGDKCKTDEGGGHSIPDHRQEHCQTGDKLGDKRNTNWETKPETRARQDQGGGHSIPNRSQVGRRDQRQAKDETRDLDRKTHWETRPERGQRGGHSIPAKVKDKARWETNWQSRPQASPARRTQQVKDKMRWEEG